MGKIIGAFASSHANTRVDPNRWDERREQNRMQYMRRYGVQPQVHPKIKEETLSVKQQRYKGVRARLDFVRKKLQEKNPDALILIGDDQNENFSVLQCRHGHGRSLLGQ